MLNKRLTFDIYEREGGMRIRKEISVTKILEAKGKIITW